MKASRGGREFDDFGVLQLLEESSNAVINGFCGLPESVHHLLPYGTDIGLSVARKPQETAEFVEVDPDEGASQTWLEGSREKSLAEFWNEKGDPAILAQFPFHQAARSKVIEVPGFLGFHRKSA
jgi:hypothetical protein